MWERHEDHKKYRRTDVFPRPSDGGICTFADCPNREENIHDEPVQGGVYDEYCHLGARRNDFSYCHHPAMDEIEKKSDAPWYLGFCEVAVREGVCPRGFTR